MKTKFEYLKNVSTSRAKRAFQLKLKASFKIFEGFYVGVYLKYSSS